jgi:hypothetical protein
MRMVHTGLATITVGFRRIWRRRVVYLGLCTTAVVFGWLAIRLWTTYLPPSPDEVVGLSREYGQSVATVQRAAGDLPRLEERVRRTAQAVLPSVVAVRSPFDKPSEAGGYQTNYASGVIITTDGIVLSQWHVSHLKRSEHEGISTDTSGSAGDRTTVILHDGRECSAELLGANRTHDISLLRLLEPGPYPHVPVRATAPVEVGGWVLKLGHPRGYLPSARKSTEPCSRSVVTRCAPRSASPERLCIKFGAFLDWLFQPAFDDTISCIVSTADESWPKPTYLNRFIIDEQATSCRSASKGRER